MNTRKAFEVSVIQLNAELLSQQLDTLHNSLSEKDYRRVLGALSNSAGHGGQKLMQRLTGTAPVTIRRGQQEMVALRLGEIDAKEDAKRVRKKGAAERRSRSQATAQAKRATLPAFPKASDSRMRPPYEF